MVRRVPSYGKSMPTGNEWLVRDTGERRKPAADGDLTALEAAQLDVLVVGGGITGACIALEAAQRGLVVGLVERNDYGAGATANCLKIVHGGLRYLQHLDMQRVRHSAVERSVWLRSAPHLVEPLPVVLPTYRGRYPPRALLAAALLVNEVFSADRNRGLLPERAIPRARLLSRRECIALEPSLESPILTGGVLFHDALMYSPERLTFEVLEAAGLAGAVTANHVEFLAPLMAGGRVAGARIRDVLSGDTAAVRARWVVNATGSHVPELANRLAQHSPAAGQAYSVAVSFVTRQPGGQVAFTVPAGGPDPDRVGPVGARQLFVVPWRGQTMIGTGHLEYRGDPAAFVMKGEYVERFAEEIAAARPDRSKEDGDIALVHGGLLPIRGRPRGGTVRLLKQHRVIDHTAEGCPGALSVITVKFTTARRVALDVVNRIAPAAAPRTSADPQVIPLPGGAFESLERLRSEAVGKYAGLLPGDVLEHLVRTYGSRYAVVIEDGRRMRDWNRRVVSDAPVIRAQLMYAAAAEQGRTPADLLWRRTELGPRGLATDAAYRTAEDVLAGVP
jgi:glycerol-3-phosphate dehydrogenase